MGRRLTDKIRFRQIRNHIFLIVLKVCQAACFKLFAVPTIIVK